MPLGRVGPAHPRANRLSQHLPAVSAANPGKRLDVTRHGVPAGTAAPFEGAFGADLAAGVPYAGTLFRLPLRSAEQAAASGISRQAYAPEDVAAMLGALREEGALVLLFLKSLRSIDVLEWREGEAAPRALFSVKAAPLPLADLGGAGAAAAAAVAVAAPGPAPAAGDAAAWRSLLEQRALFLRAAEAPVSEDIASVYSLALVTR